MFVAPPRNALTGSEANTGAPGILDPGRDDISSGTSRLAAAATRVFVMLWGAQHELAQEAVKACLSNEQLDDIKVATNCPVLAVCHASSRVTSYDNELGGD